MQQRLRVQLSTVEEQELDWGGVGFGEGGGGFGEGGGGFGEGGAGFGEGGGGFGEGGAGFGDGNPVPPTMSTSKHERKISSVYLQIQIHRMVTRPDGMLAGKFTVSG